MKALRTINEVAYNSLTPTVKSKLIFIVDNKSIFNAHTGNLNVHLNVYTSKEVEDLHPEFDENGQPVMIDENTQKINKIIRTVLTKVSFANSKGKDYLFGGVFTDQDVTDMITLLESSGEIDSQDSLTTKLSKVLLHGAKYKLSQDEAINLSIEDLEEFEI